MDQINTRLDQLKAMLKEDPNDSFLIFAISKEYEKMGHIEEAINGYEQIRKNDPDYIGTYYHLAKAYEYEEKKDVARNIYKEGISVAKSVNDMHTLAELTTALANMEMDLD